MDDLITLSNSVSKFVVGFEGNVSKKNGDKIIIKASGVSLKNISEDDFITYDFNLKQLDNFNKKGSMELDFHKYLLSFDSINYVCHTHPNNTLKILSTSLINSFANERVFPDQVIFNGYKSLIIPYVKPGEELKNTIESKMNDWLCQNNTLPQLILLKNHGIITFGKNVQECIIKTEICEKSAEVFIGAKQLGVIDFLTKKEIHELLIDERELYRKSKL